MNCKKPGSKGKYTGEEPSPKGLGYCARDEKEGEIMKGRDGENWIVSGGRWKRYDVPPSYLPPDAKRCRFVAYKVDTRPAFLQMLAGRGMFSSLIKGLQCRPGYVYKWIEYNEFEKEETELPKGARPRKLSPKHVNEYYYGDKRVVRAIPPVPDKHAKDSFYFTHDNGGVPFLVYSDSRSVCVYRIDEGVYVPDSLWESAKDMRSRRGLYQKKVACWKGAEIMPGVAQTKEDLGNSVLLSLKSGKHVFIGSEIYEFAPKSKDDPITEFYSMVGNSDVPYPVAFSKKTAYMMLDRQHVPREAIGSPTTKAEKLDAYRGFYDTEASLNEAGVHMKGVKEIHPRIW